MSLSGIANSGLNASMARMTVSAANTANAGTTGAVPAERQPTQQGGNAASGTSSADRAPVYRPVSVQQFQVAGGGTSLTYEPRTPSYVLQYDPAAPQADAAGMVAAPNVNLAQEATDRIVAGLAYQANAKLLSAASQQQLTMMTLLG